MGFFSYCRQLWVTVDNGLCAPPKRDVVRSSRAGGAKKDMVSVKGNCVFLYARVCAIMDAAVNLING